MKIKTHHDPKPVPSRNFDWSAVDDSTYDGSEGSLIGYGATEQAAREDLEQYSDDMAEAGIPEPDWSKKLRGVPNFSGMTLEQAKQVANECGLKAHEYIAPAPQPWWKRLFRVLFR